MYPSIILFTQSFYRWTPINTLKKAEEDRKLKKPEWSLLEKFREKIFVEKVPTFCEGV